MLNYFKLFPLRRSTRDKTPHRLWARYCWVLHRWFQFFFVYLLKRRPVIGKRFLVNGPFSAFFNDFEIFNGPFLIILHRLWRAIFQVNGTMAHGPLPSKSLDGKTINRKNSEIIEFIWNQGKGRLSGYFYRNVRRDVTALIGWQRSHHCHPVMTRQNR